MDQNFQTSFIPKKPMIEERVVSSRPIGLLTIGSIFVFFTVVVATGGLYFYNGVLAKNITDMQSNLKLAQNSFEPSKIVQLQSLDRRLNASNDILSKHIAISPIFNELQSITIKTVSYNKFSYSYDGAAGSKIAVQMSGIAIGYTSVALEENLFSQDKNLIDPVFSNLSLDDKGNVTFDLNFSVDPNFINYEKVLQTTPTAATVTTPTTTVTTTNTTVPVTSTPTSTTTPTPTTPTTTSDSSSSTVPNSTNNVSVPN